MTKALYLTYDGLTSPLGQSQILPYIKGLSEKGVEFTIISFEQKKFSGNKKNIETQLERLNIHWHPLPYTKKPPVLSTLWDILQLKKVAFKLHKQQNFDVGHCRSYITSLIGLKMKKKFNLKFIFDMRGFWADERVDGNLWNLNNPIYRVIYKYFKKKEKEFIQRSDAIISLTEAGKKEILSWNLGIEEGKITIIPCCADFDHFTLRKKAERDVSREQLSISKEEFVLSYLGSIGTWYMLDEMLDFFAVLKKEYSNAKFLFLTPEAPEIILQKAKAKNLNEEDFIIRYAKREEVPLLLKASDLNIFFIKPAFSKKASSPTKQGEIMSMGIPFVCNDIGDTRSIVRETGAGILVNNFTPEAYKEAIIEMNNMNEYAPAMRNAAEKYYSLERGVEKYLYIYHNFS